MNKPVSPRPTDVIPAGRAASSRIDWVDTAKGFCIILVVMMHSTLGLGDAVGGEGWLHHVVAFAQPFRIPAFFLIAGLFLSRTIDQPWPRYLDRKVLHFVYFYVLWTLIQCIVKFAPAGFERLVHQLALALVEPFGTLWFIYLLPIFFVVTKLTRRLSVWAVLAAAAALHLWPLHSGWIAIDEFMSRYVFFFVGYAFAPAAFAIAAVARRTPEAAAAAAATIFALIAAATFSPHPLGDAGSIAQLPGLSLTIGVVGAGALIAIAAVIAPTRVGRAIRHCGEHSLAIYLAFFLPMAATRIALVKSGAVGSVIDVGTASLLVTATAILVPLALRRLAANGPAGWLFERPGWAKARSADARTQWQPAG